MKDIKKLMITLVALLAVTTQAWADETLLLTIENKGNTSFYSGSKTFDDMVTVTFSNEVYNNGDASGWYGGGTASLLTVAGINGYTITSCKFYTDRGTASTGYTVQGESPSVYLFTREVFTDNSQSVSIGDPGITKIEVYGTAPSASSGPEVDWNKAEKTGTFTMPGGNVTLEPEYYPQATVADGAVTAADADARATTDDPLVKVDATKLTGAKKLMYFVSNSGTTAPAYDAEGWTDQLPTAEGFTQQGIVYVWYYPVGTDEGVDGATATYSDGDICLQSITARIAAAPTYAVTFAEGTDANEWKAEPAAGVTKGQTVTVTYTGSKKVIGVKAEKKAPVVYTMVSEATAADYGKVVCDKGHLHDAKTAVPSGCTAVGILGKVTETGHGLILALNNASSQTWNTINGWTSVTTYAGTTLKQLPDDAARGANLTSYTTLGSTTVSNWCVAQKSDYEAIFTNLGSTTGTISDGKTYDANVNAYITGVGGTEISGKCWSATEEGGNYARYFRSSNWSVENKSESLNVRPVLGF